MKMFKKGKKMLAALTLAAITVGMFGGCANNSSKEAGKDEEGRVVISIGDFADPDTNKEAYEKQMARVEEFEKLHPDIKIEPVSWSFDPRTYMAKAEGGTLPTLYYIPLTETKKVMDMGYAADITDEFKKRGFYDAVSEFTMETISRDGKVYLMPTGNYDVGFIINLDLYEKAGFVEADGTPYQPKDWDDMVRVAKVIKEKTGKAGFVFPTTEYNGGWRFLPVAWGFGTVFEEEVDGKWKAQFASEEGTAALQFIKDLKWKHDVLPANTLVNGTEVEKLMGSGEAAMCIGEGDRMNAMTKYGLPLDRMAIVQMPADPKEKATMMGGSYMVINSDATPEQISAAIEWLEYRGTTVKLTDEIKENYKTQVEEDISLNKIVGIEALTPWKSDSEVQKFKNDYAREHANVNINHVKLYNDKTGMTFHAEEPIDCQALYTTLDACIQSVLTDKNADCAEVLKKAASDFQKNNLDHAN